MEGIKVLIFLFYVSWLVISLFAQGESPLNRKIRRWDLFGLIPDFRFFCPAPVKYDYHLLYRADLSAGVFGDWTELPLGKRRPLLGAIWNPGKRERKILNKSCKLLREQSGKKLSGRRKAFHSLIRNYIDHSLVDVDYTNFAFKIIQTQDLVVGSEASVVFESKLVFRRNKSSQLQKSNE